ncbi:hypothetical protein ACFX13_003914 [Malus domestica]
MHSCLSFSCARQGIESCLPSTIPNFVLRADSFKDKKDSIESRDGDWDRITTGLKRLSSEGNRHSQPASNPKKASYLAFLIPIASLT